MTKSTPSHLRLYTERRPQPFLGTPESHESITGLCQAFEAATGWSLQYTPGSAPHDTPALKKAAPVDPGLGIALGHFRMGVHGTGAGPESPRIDIESAEELAASVAKLLGELHHTQDALWRREAELAAGVPLTPHPQDNQHLASRLEATLKGGAKALGCHAGALYLLDEATTLLKLRASWGLPRSRFTDPPRPLCDALADLEALAGHAVALEDTSNWSHWNPPETFSAAVCVPVSTPTVPLGTLWLFSTKARQFTDQETNLAEIVAGRLASDLEREMLMVEAVESAQRKRQLAAAARWQASLQPRIAPLLDGWEIAGWTEQAGEVGGDFHDWFIRRDDVVTLAVGGSQQRGIEGALSSATVRAALRSHGEYEHQPHQLLERVNRTLWTSSAGDQACHVWTAMLDSRSNAVRFSAAGAPAAFLASEQGLEPLVDNNLPLGGEPASAYASSSRSLSPGETIVAVSPGAAERAATDGGGSISDFLRGALVDCSRVSAKETVEWIQDRFAAHASQGATADCTVMVLKRRDVR